MLYDEQVEPGAADDASERPILSDATRRRLGRHLQAMYEPVIDESLDPRLAELMKQLDADRDSP